MAKKDKKLAILMALRKHSGPVEAVAYDVIRVQYRLASCRLDPGIHAGTTPMGGAQLPLLE